MKDKLRKEITRTQYINAKEHHDNSGIFTQTESMYGVYNEYYYQEDGHYFVSYRLGDNCD